MRLNDDWFRCGLLLCCSLAVMSASGRAAELEPEAAAVWQLWQDDWQCGQPQVPEPELVRELADLGGLQGVRVGELTLPVLIGSHPERLGTVLFVQHEGCWQLYPVADGHWVEGIFATPSGTRFMLFTLWSVEGPGHEYRILRAQDGFGVVDCATLTFPESLNQPEWALEYLSLHDFNADASGHASLIGFVTRHDADGNPSRQWYRYESGDRGQHWEPPRPVPQPSAALPGVFLRGQVLEPNPALLASLLQGPAMGTAPLKH